MSYANITYREQFPGHSVTELKRNERLPSFSCETKTALIVVNRNAAAIHLGDDEGHEIASFYFDKDVLIDILKEEDNETA